METEKSLITELWREHLATPFPKGLRGKDINGIDFVMLDSYIAGCVKTFIERGNLNQYQLAMLGLSYRNVNFISPVLNEEAVAYFWRLERLAEMVLKAIAKEDYPKS